MGKLRDLIPWKTGGTTPAVAGAQHPFTALQREMNRLMGDFFSGFELEPLKAWPVEGFAPRVEIEETENEIVVAAEVPGMEEKDLSIKVTADTLTISGEKKQKQERKEGSSFYSETSYGAFERVIPLEVGIDEDKIDASLKQGKLTIKLPKLESAKKTTKKVSVKVA